MKLRIVSMILTALTLGLSLSSLNAQNTMTASGGMGEVGSQVTSTVTFDTTDVLQGWSFGLCNDDANIALMGAAEGAVTLTIKAGGPADFLALETMPANGTGVTMGVVIDFFGVETLAPGAGYEILTVNYELVGVPPALDPIVTDVCFCNTLGMPAVDSVVVVGGASLTPDFVCGSFSIIPPPDYCLDLVCEGGTTDASLTWTDCSEFDYLLLHRDGVLIGSLLGTDSSYLDAGLAPGDYHYVLIGVDFPEPVGSPTIIVAECDVSIIPVTLSGSDVAVGPYLGGTTVTLTGTGFEAAMDTAVELDGVNQPNVTIIDDTTLSFVTEAVNFLGAVDVTVVNSQGSDTIVDGFTYGFIRGDMNADSAIDLADGIFALDYLFVGGPAPICEDAVDVNDDGMIDIADPIYILSHLFKGDPPPPVPFTEAGQDPTADSLGCL